MAKSSRILFFVAAGLLVVCVRLWFSLSSANEQIVEASRRASVHAPLPSYSEPTATEGTNTSAPASRASHGVVPEAIPLRPRQGALAEMMEDPAYRDAMYAQIRTQMKDRHRALARELGLSPSEAEAVFDILVELEIFSRQSLSENRGPGDRVVTAKERSDASNNADAQLMALLGASRFEEWKVYRDTFGSRLRVDQIQNALASTGRPQMAFVQEKAVIAAIHGESARMQEEILRLSLPTDNDAQSRVRYQEDMERIATDRDQRILATASQILTNEQLTALEQNLDQRRNSQTLGAAQVAQARQAREALEALSPNEVAQRIADR